MSPNPRLKVVIVGGSVAGLTLAHTFESTGLIDYILLEGRDHIAPPLGATIVIMPNGARILDQLGILASMKESKIVVDKTFMRKGNGELVSKNDWPALMPERFGYPVATFERQKVLQSLYAQIKNKEKILGNKRVVEVAHGVDSVLVKCADGTAYEGDIVIGADGIHSQVRREMQRMAHDTNPGLMKEDETGITAEYSCLFGLSNPDDSYDLPSGGSIITGSDINHSSLLFTGPKGQPQWFFVTKLDKKFRSPNIPRFTKADRDAKLAEWADFQFAPGVTLKKLVDTCTCMNSSFLPLEEVNFEHWSWGRIVCVGDSVHKMTPTIGQGGNQAIESVAVLTNCLMEILSRQTQKPTISDLEPAFKKFQKIRWNRAQMFIDLSGRVTRFDANAKLSDTIRLLFVEPPSTEVLADIQTSVFKTAPWLHHLPLPRHLQDKDMWKWEDRPPRTAVKARL